MGLLQHLVKHFVGSCDASPSWGSGAAMANKATHTQASAFSARRVSARAPRSARGAARRLGEGEGQTTNSAITFVYLPHHITDIGGAAPSTQNVHELCTDHRKQKTTTTLRLCPYLHSHANGGSPF